MWNSDSLKMTDKIIIDLISEGREEGGVSYLLMSMFRSMFVLLSVDHHNVELISDRD